MSLVELIAQHQRHLAAARRAPKTIDWYDQQLRVFVAWRSSSGRPDVIPDDLELDTFLADQHALGLSPRTVNARFRALRALLLWAEKRRRLTYADNPIHLIDAPRIPHDRRSGIAEADFARLQTSIGAAGWLDQRDQLILLLLYYCGLRVGELCALRVDDIDLQRMEVLVRSGKGSRARIVPAPAEVRPAVVNYIYARPAHAEELLIKSDGWHGAGGPLRPEGVRQMLIRRCKAAGLPPVNPHAFRHAFAMWLLNAGARLETVSAAMGHQSTAVTQAVYAYTLTATVRREYDVALDKHRRGTQTG